jgi:hypothetical protein
MDFIKSAEVTKDEIQSIYWRNEKCVQTSVGNARDCNLDEKRYEHGA